jgi:hypothetical protein
MPKLTGTNVLFLFLLITNPVIGQKLQINNYSISYRLFEMNSVGNNPTTIPALLKDRYSYQNFLSTTNYNILYGNPGVQQLHTIYFTAEWKVDSSLSLFWKKHTLQAGLLITNKIAQSAGAVANERFSYSPDTVLHEDRYSLLKNQQFLGGQIGLNRRYHISKKFQLFSGLHLQGSFAVVHHYEQQLDSITFAPTRGWTSNTSRLPHLKGKNFFQWQAMIPLGMEYDIHQKDFYIRLEIIVGIVGSRYRPKTFAAKEAHGIGLSLVYLPRQKTRP